MSSRADAELRRQLKQAKGPVEAVVRLRPEDASQPAVPPDQVERMAREVLGRVGEETGLGAEDVHVFRNLGYFVVSAERPFLKALLAQPEVASAVANRRPESLAIPPRKAK